MVLALVCLALHHLIYPGLAAGDIEVSVVSEALFPHGDVAAAGPGGMAYLVVCRQAVDHRSPSGVGNHRQVVVFIVQPLALQGVVTPVVRIQLCQVSGLLLCQHPCGGVTLTEAEPGLTLPGQLLTAQVVLQGQWGMAGYLPLHEFPRQSTGKAFRDTGGGALRDRILYGIVLILSSPALSGQDRDTIRTMGHTTGLVHTFLQLLHRSSYATAIP